MSVVARGPNAERAIGRRKSAFHTLLWQNKSLTEGAIQPPQVSRPLV